MNRVSLLWIVAFATLAVLYFFAPNPAVSESAWLLGVTLLVASAARSLRRSGGSTTGWTAITAGLAFSVAGDYVFAYNLVIAGTDVFPTIGDALYLMSYPLMAVGLTRLARTRGRTGWLEPTIDGLIVSVAASMAVWVFVLEPALADGSQPLLGRVVAAAYPIGDLLLLVTCALLVTKPVSRSPRMLLLLGAIGANLVGDVLYSVLESQGAYQAPHPIDVFWILAYAGIVAAIRTVDRQAEPVDGPQPSMNTPRLVLLGLAAASAPLLHVVAHQMDHDDTHTELLVATVALLALVVLRLWMMVDDLQATHAEATRRATHDLLTGLANRATFTQWARATTADPATVILIDVDIFHAVNEDYGQDTGDEVLRAVADVVRGVVGPDALVARIDGDQFAVLVEGPLSVGEAHAADIVVAARQSIEAGPHSVPISLSVGVAPLGRGHYPLLRADEALHEAKRSGRDTHVVLDPPTEGPTVPLPVTAP